MALKVEYSMVALDVVNPKIWVKNKESTAKRKDPLIKTWLSKYTLC